MRKVVIIIVLFLFIIIVSGCKNNTQKSSIVTLETHSLYVNPQNFDEALFYNQNAYLATCKEIISGNSYSYYLPQTKYKLFHFEVNEIIYEQIELKKNDFYVEISEAPAEFVLLNNNIDPFVETNYEIGKEYLIIGCLTSTPYGIYNEYISDYSHLVFSFDESVDSKIVGRNNVLTRDGKNIKNDFTRDELINYIKDFYNKNKPKINSYLRINESDVDKIFEYSNYVFECKVEEKVGSFDGFYSFNEYRIKVTNIYKELYNEVSSETISINTNKEIHIRVSPNLNINIGDIFTAGYDRVSELEENSEIIMCSLSFIRLFNSSDINGK